MLLYLYNKNTRDLLDEIEADEFFHDRAICRDTVIYFGQEIEVSSTPDLSEALRGQKQMLAPSVEDRIFELECLLAETLFGGDSYDG